MRLALTRTHAPADNASMDDKPVKRAAGGAAIMATTVVAFLILPMIYLLAIGPIVWLHRRGRLDIGPNSIIARMYSPAEWAASACPPFDQAMQAYISLWEPRPPPTGTMPYAPPAPTSAAIPAPAPAPATPASEPQS